jgi:hypothetical protein
MQQKETTVVSDNKYSVNYSSTVIDSAEFRLQQTRSLQYGS